MPAADAIGIGILGFGGFAMFAAQEFAQVPDAALWCITGTHREASLVSAARFGLVDVQPPEALFARPGVRLVCITSPSGRVSASFPRGRNQDARTTRKPSTIGAPPATPIRT
jgi:hypothetical protein